MSCAYLTAKISVTRGINHVEFSFLPRDRSDLKNIRISKQGYLRCCMACFIWQEASQPLKIQQYFTTAINARDYECPIGQFPHELSKHVYHPDYADMLVQINLAYIMVKHKN